MRGLWKWRKFQTALGSYNKESDPRLWCSIVSSLEETTPKLVSAVSASLLRLDRPGSDSPHVEKCRRNKFETTRWDASLD